MKNRVINITHDTEQLQKQLIQSVLEGQEKERFRIGKELQDSINQQLSTIKLYIEMAREGISGKPADIIGRVYDNLDIVITEIQELSDTLLVPVTGDLGLVESIQGYCDLLQTTHGFRVDFQHKYFSEKGIPEGTKLILFRILQVQADNIIQHADAGEVFIKLISDAEEIMFSISDNGKGFDPARYKRRSGLAGIMIRTGYLNGRTEIDSLPGNGCRLTVTIPNLLNLKI